MDLIHEIHIINNFLLIHLDIQFPQPFQESQARICIHPQCHLWRLPVHKMKPSLPNIPYILVSMWAWHLPDVIPLYHDRAIGYTLRQLYAYGLVSSAVPWLGNNGKREEGAVLEDYSGLTANIPVI